MFISGKSLHYLSHLFCLYHLTDVRLCHQVSSPLVHSSLIILQERSRILNAFNEIPVAEIGLEKRPVHFSLVDSVVRTR